MECCTVTVLCNDFLQIETSSPKEGKEVFTQEVNEDDKIHKSLSSVISALK